MWPFTRKPPAPLDPNDLRDRLIAAAATGSARKLRAECRKYQSQVAEHVDMLAKAPDELLGNESSAERYNQCLIAVAQCLANDCGAPELWTKLSAPSADNPYIRWNQWIDGLPDRMQTLEYETLIKEARSLIEQAKAFRGRDARRYECYLHGHLGQLLFHSGRVTEAIEPFQIALSSCVETQDIEGQIAYLNSLIEAHRYLNDGQAVPLAEEVLEVMRRNRLPTTDQERRLQLLRKGEPLCRVTCLRDDQELELDELTWTGEGSYRFQFKRNRYPLQKASTLTSLGNQLASEGKLSDALEKYEEASEVDPHDPDPVYQSGMCLLELGAYAKGREAFEEVERLAPGWFRCRRDRWLAEGLEQGTISSEELQMLRALEDGGLPPEQATQVAQAAVERYPDFAPFYLFLGDSKGDAEEACATYRQGLDRVDDPDLESRLLCALVSRLPVESPERTPLLTRAMGLNGSLVASAMLKLLSLR